MNNKKYAEFIKYLQEELSVVDSELELALRGGNTEPCLLLVTLWRYGFLTIQELEKGFDGLTKIRLEPTRVEAIRL